jgi:uncharacterized protein
LTALDRAVASGQGKMIRYLLSLGAQITRTTLIVADKSVYSSPAWLDYLQLYQLRQLRPKTAHNKPADERLLIAAQAGNDAGAQQALAEGADANASDDQDIAALRWAARGGHDELVKALIAGGAAASQRSSTGWTALLEAVLGGHEGLVAYLIGVGADVNAVTLSNASILYLARDVIRFASDKDKAQRIVSLLEEKGAESIAPAADDED